MKEVKEKKEHKREMAREKKSTKQVRERKKTKHYFEFWLCYFVEDILSNSWTIGNSSGTVFRGKKQREKWL